MVSIIGRMLLALVVVLGIMWALARWARKPMTGKSDGVMSVLARQQLSRSSSVTVLRVMDRALVLGITESAIRVLGETDLAPIEEVLAGDSGSRPWSRRKPDAIAAPEESEWLTVIPAAEPVALTAAPAPVFEPATTSAPARPGKLDGSVLSPNTWKQLVGAAREITVRR